MGTGFTADTPVRVAQYGISSVISLSDDIMLEKLREFYCKIYNIVFEPVSSNKKNAREERITLYLNLIDQIVKDKFKELKKNLNDKSNSIMIYIEMLPDMSELKKEFYQILNKSIEKYKNSKNHNTEITNFRNIFANNDATHNICLADLPEVKTG
jgi:GTPase involved in cell partitioning and DNA repair